MVKSIKDFQKLVLGQLISGILGESLWFLGQCLVRECLSKPF